MEIDKGKKKSIVSYSDLEVFQNTYSASIRIIKEILPKIPDFEKFDLIDQLRRSTRAIPRLIAEGYAKKHQKYGFQKYLYDAMAENNETIVTLSQIKDIYNIDTSQYIKLYEITGKQLYRLSQSWTRSKNNP